MVKCSNEACRYTIYLKYNYLYNWLYIKKKEIKTATVKNVNAIKQKNVVAVICYVMKIANVDAIQKMIADVVQ